MTDRIALNRMAGPGLRAVGCALLLSVVSACNGAHVVVRNHSRVRLQNVTVSAKGASESIGTVDPGGERRTALCPKGEAGSTELSFIAEGWQHRRQLPVYFECDFLYRVHFDVSPTFQVTAAASLY